VSATSGPTTWTTESAYAAGVEARRTGRSPEEGAASLPDEFRESWASGYDDEATAEFARDAETKEAAEAFGGASLFDGQASKKGKTKS